MKELRGKLGSLSGSYYRVKRLRNEPVVGQRVELKDVTWPRGHRWAGAVVTDITQVDGQPFFWFSRR